MEPFPERGQAPDVRLRVGGEDEADGGHITRRQAAAAKGNVDERAADTAVPVDLVGVRLVATR